MLSDGDMLEKEGESDEKEGRKSDSFLDFRKWIWNFICQVIILTTECIGEVVLFTL